MNFGTPDISPGDNVALGWRQTNEARDGARFLDRRRGSMRDVLADSRRRRSSASEGMFPFKVYTSRLAFDDTTFLTLFPDNTTWWRVFTVRCGRINGTPLVDTGCDGYDTDPFGDYFPMVSLSGQPVQPILIPAATAKYFLWIELLAGGVPKLRQGTNILSDPKSIQQWVNYPAPDQVHFQIAEINTTAPYEASIRQIANDDIWTPWMVENTSRATAGGDQPVQTLQLLLADVPAGFPPSGTSGVIKFREIADCVSIAGIPTKVYRQALVSDYYSTAYGNT